MEIESSATKKKTKRKAAYNPREKSENVAAVATTRLDIIHNKELCQ